MAFCAGLPGPTAVAYEAGPTGYGLARALHAAGIGCVVAAPGKIERPAQDKIKTDQCDAERVLRLLMIDALHGVRVPTVEEEAVRDLVRAREDLRGDLMRTRQRLSKLLLRHGIVYEDTSSTWTQRHRGGCARRISAAVLKRRCWTTSARSTRSSAAAGSWRRQSPSSSRARRTHRPSRGSAACAG